MESKDTVRDRCMQLRDPFWHSSESHVPESITPPGAASFDFPQSTLCKHEGDDSQEDIESFTGPQRSAPNVNGKPDKEKKKRTRVTPEQLVHLERFFAMDRNPTAARRKDISDFLGMQERQTQIWFQNRRAKAKLQDGKPHAQYAEPWSDTPSPHSASFSADLHNLIREEGPVTIISCTDLSIGSWRRIASSAARYDLVAYVSEAKRCLTWFIHSSGHGFKMEVPLHTIADTEFKQVSSGTGLAVLVLSQPPIFYMEKVTPNEDGYTLSSYWKRCSDWTENRQATKVLRHTVVGSAGQLSHFLRSLQSNPLLSVFTSNSTPMNESVTSAVGLQCQMYPYQHGVTPPAVMDNAVLQVPYMVDGDLRSPYGTPPTVFSSQQSHLSHDRTLSSTSDFQPNIYQQRPPSSVRASPSSAEIQLSPNSPASYSSSPGVSQHMYPGASPPLLTSPYASQAGYQLPSISNSSSPHSLAGMPGISYETEANLLNQHTGQI